MKPPIEALEANLNASIEAKRVLLQSPAILEQFGRMVDTVVKAYQAGGRLYIAGNGGSAADAQHLAAEFVSKLARPRSPLPAEALTVDSSILTAIGNDYGYEQVFSRQIRGKMTSKDVFLGITTSGRSPNILEALKECRRLEVPSLVLTGCGGGEARELADVSVVVPSTVTSQIQELHIVMYHTLCGLVEDAMFPSLSLESSKTQAASPSVGLST